VVLVVIEVRESSGGLLVRDGAEPPRLVDGDGGQPLHTARVERDVGAAQQRRSGGVARILDDLLGDPINTAADGARESLGMVDVERSDLLIAALASGNHGLALLGARRGPGFRGLGCSGVQLRTPEGESKTWRRAQRLKRSPSGRPRAAAKRCP
jgi:hypothetical protein